VYFCFFYGCLGGRFCDGDIGTGSCDWNSYINDVVARNIPVIAICSVIMFLSLVLGIICCTPLRKRRLNAWAVPIYIFFIIAGCILLCIANASVVNNLNPLTIDAENQTLIASAIDNMNLTQIGQYISGGQANDVLANLNMTKFGKLISDGGGIGALLVNLTQHGQNISGLPDGLGNITQYQQYISDAQNLTNDIVLSIETVILFENLWTYITVAIILTWSILTYFYLLDNSIAWRSAIALYAFIILFMICISLISYQLLSTVLNDICYDLSHPTGFLSYLPNQFINQITTGICHLEKEFDMIVAGDSLLVAGLFIFTLLVFF